MDDVFGVSSALGGAMLTRRGMTREASIRVPAIVQDSVWANAAMVTLIAIKFPITKKGLDGMVLALRPYLKREKLQKSEL